MGDAKRRGTFEQRRANTRGPCSNHGKTHAEWSLADFFSRLTWKRGGHWKLDPNASPPGAMSAETMRQVRRRIFVNSKADLPDPNADQRS